MLIAVDFDGTLCEDRYPLIGPENNEILVWCIVQQRAGHKLALNTNRHGEDLAQAIEWAKGKGIVFDAVIDKPLCDIYLDDRNMKLGDITVVKNAEEFIRGK